MSLFGELFKSRELYMLTGAGGSQVHLGFVDGRKAAYFFTSQDKAAGYIRANSLRGGLAKVNWKTFGLLRADLVAAHVRQAAIDPRPGEEEAALVLPLEEVAMDNPVIWGQTAT
ncbi:MAG: hypothetical protein FJZ01_22135 [Candidatus Sericytochromatia bacterium]|nr:hypothetical protein [Candidatus Tanganyikabacteria bacterium]